MASRMVHYVIAKELAKQLKIQDENAFVLGAIICDSYRSDEKKVKATSHFLRNYEKGRTYDYRSFYDKYLSKKQSDFALGYMLHLIMDCINLKDVIATTIYQYPIELRKAKVALLYEDMHIHNTLLKHRYHLTYDLTPLTTFEIEEIDIEDQIPFLKVFESDFIDVEIKAFHMLTQEILDDYMDKCRIICFDILKKVMDHQQFDDPEKFALDYKIK